jgi:hypothetical protein
MYPNMPRSRKTGSSEMWCNLRTAGTPDTTQISDLTSLLPPPTLHLSRTHDLWLNLYPAL